MGGYMQPYQKNAAVSKEAIRSRMERILEIGTMPLIDTNDPVAVNDRLNWYFQKCVDDEVYATIAGVACALGVSRQALGKWHRHEVHKPAEVLAMVDAVYNMINMQYEEMMQDGEINPIAGIFLMRNNHNYTNADDTRPIAGETAEKTPEEIMRKYQNQLTD